MRRCIFIYARSDSKRLPGKVLMPLAGRKLIDIVVDRVKCVPAEECFLLTSDRAVDNKLVSYVRSRGINVVRGHSNDLVNRTLKAINETKATHFLRVNGDSPFFSPELARYSMQILEGADIVSNILNRYFPYGVAVEWVSASSYKKFAESALPHEREHVTQHLYRQISNLNAFSLEQRRDDSRFKLALDTKEDYSRLHEIINHRDPTFLSYWEALKLTEPDLHLHPF